MLKTARLYIALLSAVLLLTGCVEDKKTDANNEPNKQGLSIAEIAVDQQRSTIFVQRGTDATDAGVARLVGSMQQEGIPFYKTFSSPDGMIAAGDIVILKIDLASSGHGNTNPDLVASVIDAIADHPDGFKGEIVISDNSHAYSGAFSLSSEPASAEKIAWEAAAKVKRKVAVSGYSWSRISGQLVEEFSTGDHQDGFVSCAGHISYPKFTTVYGTELSFKNGVWSDELQKYDSARLKVINMPVLKYNPLYQVTGALSSYVGVAAGNDSNARAQATAQRENVAKQLTQTRMPVLTILDMTWVSLDAQSGTTGNAAVQKNIIAAGTDPVALDFWAGKYILLPEKVKQSRKGQVGHFLSPESTNPGTFGYWLGRTRQELQKSGIKVTMVEKDMRVIDKGNIKTKSK